MSPNDLTAVATVAGVIVAAVFGVGGLVFGIVGLVQASRAKTLARRANAIARKANRIAGGANKLAIEANTLSTQANDLAEVSSRVVVAQDARQTERSDVEWEWRWDTVNPDQVIIQNIGKSLAKDVVAQFWVGDYVKANAESPVDIEGQHELTLLIPELAEMRRLAAQFSEAERLQGDKPVVRAAQTRLRVTWQTPLGSPGKHDTQYQISELVTSADELNYLVWWVNTPER